MPRTSPEMIAKKEEEVRALIRANPEISVEEMRADLLKRHPYALSDDVLYRLRREVLRLKHLQTGKRSRAPKKAARPPARMRTKKATPEDGGRIRGALSVAVEALHNAAQANGQAPRIAQLGLARVHLLLLEDGHLPSLRDLKTLIGGTK